MQYKHLSIFEREDLVIYLEVRGLDRCLSYGRDGFERHVALSIVATNVHRIGLLLQRTKKAQLQQAELRIKQRIAA